MDLLLSLLDKPKASNVQNNHTASVNKPESVSLETLWTYPTDEDWEIILKGATEHTYNADEVIITEGQITGKLFQVTRGRCKIVKRNRSPPEIHEIDESNGIFGTIV